MAERRVTEADIRAVLAGAYTPEGIDTWLAAPNRNLAGLSPRTMLRRWRGDRLVLAEAERAAGGM